MLRRITVILGLILTLLFVVGCDSPPTEISVQPRPLSQRPEIAVVDFTNATNSAGIGRGVADMLEADLVQTQRYQVISRHQWNAILREQIYQNLYLHPERAVRTGEMVGAKYLITGSVNQARVEPVRMSVADLSFQGHKATVSVTLQVIEVATGTIVEAFDCFGSATQASGRVLDIEIGNTGWEGSLLGKACRDAIAKAVNHLAACI